MKKRYLAAALAVIVVPVGAASQRGGPSAPDAVASLPAFDVVSVKENRSNDEGQRMQLRPGGRVTITNAPPRALIQQAYGLLPQQLTGGPDWLDSTRYDIVAQTSQQLPPSPPGGPPGLAQLMLQRLLAERFDFTFAVDPGAGSGTGGGADGASIFTALEEQLGLKLRPVRAPVDVLVIDRVERPTED